MIEKGQNSTAKTRGEWLPGGRRGQCCVLGLPQSETRIPRRQTEGELLRVSLKTTGAAVDCSSPSLPPSPPSLLHGAVVAVVMVVVLVKEVVVVVVVLVMMEEVVVEVLEVMSGAGRGGGGPASPGPTPVAEGVRSKHATSQPPPPIHYLYAQT